MKINTQYCFGTLRCPIHVCENCDESRDCAEKYNEINGIVEEEEEDE